MADAGDNNVVLKKVAAQLREARETSAKLADQLLAIEQLLEGTDPVREISEFWQTHWGAKYRTDYHWSYAKDRANIKRLLKTLPVFDMKARIVAYLSSDDRFHVQNQHPFGVFVATINAWGGKVKPRPIGCLHQPPCQDDVEHTQKRQQELRA